MSERRINIPTKDTSFVQNQSNNYYRSHTHLDVNRTSNNNNQKSFQKHRAAKKFSFVQNNQESIQIISKKNLDTELSKKQLCQELTFDNGHISHINSEALHQEEKSVWQKVDELIKRIKFKKYIKTFLSLSRIRLYKHLTQNQLTQINDLSIYQQNDRNTSKDQEFIKGNKLYIVTLLNSFSIPVFLPQNYILNMWQILKISSIAVCYFFYLVAFSINVDLEHIFYTNILLMCQIFLVLDIFVTINTAIYIRGILSLNRREIFSYYKQTIAFYYDICSIFFTSLYYILLLSGVEQSRALLSLLLPIVFKLNDFQVIIKKIKLKFQFDRKMQNLIELINLIKNIIFISHIFACIWLIIGKVSQEYNNEYPGSYNSAQSSSKDGNQNNSWIYQMNLDNSSWYTQYLYSYYFITVTMCTVGYGDIRPTNPLEVSISVFLIITCCIVFGFTLNSIGEIFQDFFTKEKMIQEKRYVIANYMDKNQIDENTRKNIFEYLEYYWKESLDENLQEENKIISQLSDNLKEELLIQSNKLILKESRVLKENFSLELLSKCIPIIKEQKLTPGEILIQQEEGNVDCSLIFVLFGELEVYNKQSNNLNLSNHTKNRESICFLSQGNSFGEKSFFSGETQSLSVKSRHFSKILKIKREDFMQVIKEDKEQYEKFIYLQDKLRFDEQISYLNSKCQSCFSNLHEIDKCPSLHFIPKKMKIFGMNQISLPQVRNSQFKRTNKKYGTLENFPYNTQAFLDFLEVQFEDLDLYDQRYFQYSMFKTRAKQLTVEDDEFDTVKNIYEVQRSKQITNDFLESPKVAAEKKKLSYKKKSGQITFQNTVGSIPIFPNGEYSDKDLQNPNKIKNIIVPQVCQDVETYNQYMVAEQHSSLITSNEQEIPYLQLNDNQFNNIERILQQNRIASAFKRSSSKDNNNNIQHYERIRNKQETQIKIAQRLNQNAEHVINYESKSSICVILEENEFDLLQGKFESQENYQYYFPKYNLKNVINQLNPHSCQSNKLKKVHNNISSQIKDNQLYSKLNKNIHQLLKERDIASCRSITRSKGKIQSESSLDKIEKIAAGGSQNLINKTIGKNNLEKELQKINIQLDLSQQNFQVNQSVINESKQYQLYEEQISIKLESEDPQTPPQNELQIPQLEIVSIGLIKNQNYNFSSSCLETSKQNVNQFISKSQNQQKDLNKYEFDKWVVGVKE